MERRTIPTVPGSGTAAVLPGMDLNAEQVNAPPRTFIIGQKRFGRYEGIRLIGEGAMGKVFLARDPVLNRQVAIKVIAVDKTLDEKTRREYLARFSLEAKLSAQLNHQSIVPVYDAGEEGGIPWIAFQFIDGVTLDKILKKHGKVSIKWALHIAFDIASALQQAHLIRVVHRDIKPANIIVERSGGIAKLTDFGVAKTPWAALTCEGNAMGSPGYMSPEQIEGYAIDERSDLFSLGVVLYEMVTGKHPFLRDSIAATAYAIIGGTYTPACEVVRGVPRKLDALITQCLSTDPDKRVPSASKLIDQLRAITSGNSIRTRSRLSEIKSGPWFWLNRILGAVPKVYSALVEKKKPAAPAIGKTWTSSRIAVSPHPATGSLPRRVRTIAGLFNFQIFSRTMRMSRSNAAMLALGTATLLGLFIANLMLSAANGAGEKLFLPVAGLDKKEKALVSGFRSWLIGDNLDSAQVCARMLAEAKQGSVLGQFMLGIVACREGNYSAALPAFEAARFRSEGAKLFTRNRRYMLRANASQFERGRAPDGLVTVLAKQFGAGEDPWIKKAVYDKSYWLRWNALRIMQSAGKQIDIARVFMLDLKFADNVHTRMQAARDLGELDDRRAVPALREACAKGKSDALVAAAAAQALKDMLKK